MNASVYMYPRMTPVFVDLVWIHDRVDLAVQLKPS